MARFDRNPNTDFHKFDGQNTHKYGSGQFRFKVEQTISEAVPIWELHGLTKEEYYVQYPPTPAWQMLKISKEEWENTYMPKEIQPPIQEIPSLEEKKDDIPGILSNDVKADEQPVEEPVKIELVKKTVNKIEKKIRSKVKWS